MLEHHAVGVERSHAQAAVVARNGAAHDVGEDRGTLGIGVEAVGHQARMGVERGVEVDELRPGVLGHPLDAALDFGMPVARARLEAVVAVRDGREARHQNAARGISLAERVDERPVVGDELVAVMGPVARVGVVDAEVDDHDVGSEGQRLGALGLLVVGTVTAA